MNDKMVLDAIEEMKEAIRLLNDALDCICLAIESEETD